MGSLPVVNVGFFNIPFVTSVDARHQFAIVRYRHIDSSHNLTADLQDLLRVAIIDASGETLSTCRIIGYGLDIEGKVVHGG